MAFEKSIVTKILSKENFKHELSTIVSILNKNSISSVNILFGFAWGNEYCNWTPFKVDTGQIEFEISKTEQLKVGQFGDDDFHIILNEAEVEILFCHERDIHLSFNKRNLIVTDIMRMWDEKKIVQMKT